MGAGTVGQGGGPVRHIDRWVGAVVVVSGPDELDEAILRILEADARLPVTGIARRLGLARSTVQQRLARLEREGEIAAYTIRRGRPRAPGVAAHVEIVVDPRHAGDVVRHLAAIDEVRALHAVSGAADFVADVRAATAAALDDVLDRIRATPGVSRTTTSVVLAVKFDRDTGPGGGSVRA